MCVFLCICVVSVFVVGCASICLCVFLCVFLYLYVVCLLVCLCVFVLMCACVCSSQQWLTRPKLHKPSLVRESKRQDSHTRDPHIVCPPSDTCPSSATLQTSLPASPALKSLISHQVRQAMHADAPPAPASTPAQQSVAGTPHLCSWECGGVSQGPLPHPQRGCLGACQCFVDLRTQCACHLEATAHSEKPLPIQKPLITLCN